MSTTLGPRLASICALLLAGSAAAQEPVYVTVQLPKGVAIVLPRNWVVVSGNQRTTLAAVAIARMARAGIADFRSDLAFAANYYDDELKTAAMVNVRYYPEQTISHEFARSSSAAFVRQLDEGLQEGVRKVVATSGQQLLRWYGTTKQTFNGTTAFVSGYRRTSPNGFFRVRLVRVLDAGRSFTLTLAYREDQAQFLEPITDYIMTSLRR